MLRITLAQTETKQPWTLCGQLTGPWVAELRACWEHGRQVAGGAHNPMDLSDVTFNCDGSSVGTSKRLWSRTCMSFRGRTPMQV
jgi:hypothetical protein